MIQNRVYPVLLKSTQMLTSNDVLFPKSWKQWFEFKLWGRAQTLINHRCAKVRDLNDSPKARTNIPNGEIARQTNKRLKQYSKTFKQDNVLGKGNLMNTHREIDILCVVSTPLQKDWFNILNLFWSSQLKWVSSLSSWSGTFKPDNVHCCKYWVPLWEDWFNI